jgi:hypothetical protein
MTAAAGCRGITTSVPAEPMPYTNLRVPPPVVYCLDVARHRQRTFA